MFALQTPNAIATPKNPPTIIAAITSFGILGTPLQFTLSPSKDP